MAPIIFTNFTLKSPNSVRIRKLDLVEFIPFKPNILISILLISNKTRFNAHFKAEFETSDLADNLEICGDNGQLLGQSFLGRIEVQHVFNFQIVQGTDRIELIVVTDLDDYHE